MQRALILAALALPLGACDGGGSYAPSSTQTLRRDVTYMAYATGPRYRYRLSLTGLWPLPVQRDTAGSISMTYSVPCGDRVTLTVEAIGAVPSGANVEVLMAVQGQPVASSKGSARVYAAGTLVCR